MTQHENITRWDCDRFKGKSKPEAFDLPEFTHYCGVNLKGKFTVGCSTQRKRQASSGLCQLRQNQGAETQNQEKTAHISDCCEHRA